MTGRIHDAVKQVGFVAGAASPCCYHRCEDDVSCVAQGDDFTFEGTPESLSGIPAALKKVWLVKVRAMLDGKRTTRSMKRTHGMWKSCFGVRAWKIAGL